MIIFQLFSLVPLAIISFSSIKLEDENKADEDLKNLVKKSNDEKKDGNSHSKAFSFGADNRFRMFVRGEETEKEDKMDGSKD